MPVCCLPTSQTTPLPSSPCSPSIQLIARPPPQVFFCLDETRNVFTVLMSLNQSLMPNSYLPTSQTTLPSSSCYPGTACYEFGTVAQGSCSGGVCAGLATDKSTFETGLDGWTTPATASGLAFERDNFGTASVATGPSTGADGTIW